MTKEELHKRELETLKEDFADLKRYLDEIREILPISVCTLSSFWVVVDINKATEILTEYKPLEIIGHTIDIIFKEKQKLEKVKKEVEKSKKTISKELVLISKSKKEIPVNISIACRKDPEGNLIGYFLIASDISRSKRYQRELEQKTKALKEAKTTLEIKVKARTKELKELAESLDEQVRERTKELQKRIGELEKFHKLTVGRELKMVELKKEIKGLKEELEKKRE